MKKSFSKEELLDLSLRYKSAYNMNERFIPQIIRAVKLAAPLSDGLNVLYNYCDTGDNLNKFIYNSTPKWCSNARANKLHSLLLPINRIWGSIHSIDNDNNSIYEEDYTKKVFNIIDKSNLHSIAKSFFLDLNIGCGAIWVDSPSKERPVVFKNIAGITLMPEYSDDPENTNVWFKKIINWRDLNILNPSIAKDKDISEQFNITCGYIDVSTEQEKKYAYIQFLNDNFEEPICIEFSKWRQLILVNETLRAGESRGHGIILQILEDIEYLNDITGKLKGYVKYSANPDLLVNDNVPFNFGKDGGGNIFPTELVEDGRSPVQPIEWNLNIPAIENMIQALEQKVRMYFNIMPLGLPENTPHATATEVGYRQADEERQSIADLSRVANETLGGIMKSVFDILKYRGIIKVNKKDIEFKFDSPAVDIQSQDDLNSILQLSEMSTQILGQGAANLYMDKQKTFNELVKNLKVSKDILNSPSQVQAIKADIKEKADQMLQDKKSQQNIQPQEPSPAEPINPTPLGQSSNITGVGY